MALTSFEAATLAERPAFRGAVKIHLLKAAVAVSQDGNNTSQAYARGVLRGEYDLAEWSYAIAASHLLMADADVSLDEGDEGGYGITTEIQTAVESLLPVFAAADAAQA